MSNDNLRRTEVNTGGWIDTRKSGAESYLDPSPRRCRAVQSHDYKLSELKYKMERIVLLVMPYAPEPPGPPRSSYPVCMNIYCAHGSHEDERAFPAVKAELIQRATEGRNCSEGLIRAARRENYGGVHIPGAGKYGTKNSDGEIRRENPRDEITGQIGKEGDPEANDQMDGKPRPKKERQLKRRVSAKKRRREEERTYILCIDGRGYVRRRFVDISGTHRRDDREDARARGKEGYGGGWGGVKAKARGASSRRESSGCVRIRLRSQLGARPAPSGYRSAPVAAAARPRPALRAPSQKAGCGAYDARAARHRRSRTPITRIPAASAPRRRSTHPREHQRGRLSAAGGRRIASDLLEASQPQSRTPAPPTSSLCRTARRGPPPMPRVRVRPHCASPPRAVSPSSRLQSRPASHPPPSSPSSASDASPQTEAAAALNGRRGRVDGEEEEDNVSPRRGRPRERERSQGWKRRRTRWEWEAGWMRRRP
ncbi:hypothetical protein DFH09DRAFT_1505334 [Mycena vulgaris]|nr:hypothetical protein DFH09DRAFT_1505334 [Mycena vulgaris]